jgi:hypothetical protein
VKQSRLKQERIIEAVRHGLEGDAAVAFIHNNGYAMTVAGIARHLRTMGGRGFILECINEGMSNHEILTRIFPEEDLHEIEPPEPDQQELFQSESASHGTHGHPGGEDPFEFTKLTLKVPSDLYEAIKLAAHAEGKSRTDLIIEILETTLSRMPDSHSDGMQD